jgi:putative oxidoreductase
MLGPNWRRLDLGLLILRVGVGISFMHHGWPKMFGGPDRWASLGGVMENVGIAFLPALWGFMAAFSELVGGLCFVLGLFFRPACVLLTLTMIVAAISHFAKGDSYTVGSHAVEAAVLFVSMFLVGPGGYGVDVRLRSRRTG